MLMNTRKTLLLFVGISTFFCILILINIVINKRSYYVIPIPETPYCFLVEQAMSISSHPEGGFRYTQGKNGGHIFFVAEGKLREDYSKAKLNQFEGRYFKDVNKRVYQYLVAEGRVLEDQFTYREKFPLNLVPYKEDCEKFKMNYPVKHFL